MSYQVFISYRRSCESWVAEIIKDRLSALGYGVFLDIDSLNAGNWEKGIRQGLDESTDFVVILAPGSLERCATDSDDVMRKEIEYALDNGKNIIPILWKGYEKASAFGTNLPPKVCEVFKFNGVPNAGDPTCIRASCNRLISLLRSNPSDSILVTEQDLYGVSSSHDPMKASEIRRLHIQAQYSEDLDAKCFAYAKRIIGRSRNLIALDIGCADGFVTRRRLTKKNGFAQVIGIDKSAKAIDCANSLKKKSIYSYYTINVESTDFENHLNAIMVMSGVKSFDVIYSAFALHHLDDPISVLRIVNRYLSPNGVVIIRGVDDGAQIGYGFSDDGTIDKTKSVLIDENRALSIQTRGMSKRFHGRQFYSWLTLAGYRNIKYEYSIIDTVGMTSDERSNLFDYYFKFRKDYTQRQLNIDPTNQAYKVHHQKMVQNLDSIEAALTEDDRFYYMVMAFGAIAKKY